ncbi:helix-turn-helix domain-containing protein [Paenibacillus mesophilus]|uniref:helix-turn-helix domain-containing protein n=1 Tax=Paenibacillus mesophilus TaxID=2582849 RepID=UPI00110ECB5F|nr:helix-turn-helix domain-containing protein [Paenibacillus mesophilus]TMV45018.1 helix-turn-helix domain-containing protein [Paenibacillus mesophilus]
MFKIPINVNSLFIKSMISFMAIIVLLASFNYLSFAFFKTNIQREIIQHNRVALENAADRYEKHLSIIETLLFKLYQDENVVSFGRQLAEKETGQVNYLKPADMMEQIRRDVNNPFLYLDNIIVFYNSASFTVDKNGTGDADRTFSRFYASEPYGHAFWQQQFKEPYTSALLPSRLFSVVSSDKQNKLLFPMAVKLPGYSHLVIGLLDAQQLFESFYSNDSPAFSVVRQDGTVLFDSSGPASSDKRFIPSEAGDYVAIDNIYYFYKKSGESGLTYMTSVPYATIAGQIAKLKWTLLVLFVLSVIIAATASVVFSRKINAPVKQIIASLRHRSPEVVQSSIYEFALINEISRELIQERNDIHVDLQNKTSLLTDFGYISKLKMIATGTGAGEWNEAVTQLREFRIVLFQLNFRHALLQAAQLKADRLTYAARECVDLMMSDGFEHSRTLQTESNQLVSVVYGEEGLHKLEETLSVLKTIFDRDKEHYLVTAAVSDIFQEASDFNRAYTQVSNRAKQAALRDEMQIVWEDAAHANHFVFTAEQEQEFYVNMQEGNGPACEQLIGRMLEQMYKKEAFRLQFRAFAQGVTAKMIKITEKAKVDPDLSEQLNAMLPELEECYTLDDYRLFFDNFVSVAADSIKRKRDEKDPVVEFFADYLETHYAEDLSLDSVADRMNMSSNYLSAYIKEKTGTNFSDHLNNVRIRQAKEMLYGTSLTIQDIGERIGYRNVTSFIRMFKKITGLTPGDYRKRSALESKAGLQA